MGYFKQNDNAIAWGVIGYVEEPKVVATANGNVQVLKFSIAVGTNQDGTKHYTNVECWGVQAQREDIIKWNTAFVAGKIKTSTFTTKDNTEYEKTFIRADFIQIDKTAQAFKKIKDNKENDAKADTQKPNDLPEDFDTGDKDLPF